MDIEAELEFGVSLDGLLYLGGWNGVRRMRGNDNSMGDSSLSTEPILVKMMVDFDTKKMKDGEAAAAPS